MKKLLPPTSSVLSSLLALLALAMCVSAAAQKSPSTAAPAPPPILLGTAWYPEQWPESRWPADLDLMQKAGIHFVRVGEFAWSTMEPSEGDYQFDWLERAIDEAGKRGIYTVLGTPTAAPPAWLTQKYPETLRTEEDGRKAEHGNRQQFNWDNPKYRELARDIARRMAKRFGHNPYVIGWQIDNEYSEVSFDPQTRDRLSELAETPLRHAGQSEYALDHGLLEPDVQQLESDSHRNRAAGNPGLLLSWKRFVSDTWRSYQKNQLDAIRENAAPRQFITTNMMGWFQGYDHYVVAKDLDLAAWDDYVGEGHLDPYKNGSADDLTRGFKQKEFLDHGNAARPRQLGAHQQRSGQGRNARHGLGEYWPWCGRGQLLAVAQRSEWAGGVSRHAGRPRRHTGSSLS